MGTGQTGIYYALLTGIILLVVLAGLRLLRWVRQ